MLQILIYLTWLVYTSDFRMRLPHYVAIFYNLPWFCSIKVSNKKSQPNAVNACGNRMYKCAFKCVLKLKKSKVLNLLVDIFATSSAQIYKIVFVLFWYPKI